MIGALDCEFAGPPTDSTQLISDRNGDALQRCSTGQCAMANNQQCVDARRNCQMWDIKRVSNGHEAITALEIVVARRKSSKE